MQYYEFDCGCKIPIIDEKVKDIDGLPSMEIDYYNINRKCPAMWSLFAEGKTKGVFQLETQLGHSWSKSLKPCSPEELSALIALIRPGTLRAIVDGKSMTKHYLDRKNGDEEYDIFHELASDIIGSTYGIAIYQEQTLALSKVFAGFNLSEADMLRRSMGKKDSALMEQCREMFIKGCLKTQIISESDANALFDIIEKSNRYSFNKCLDPLTVVETDIGLKTLDELTIGDKVKAPLNDTEEHFVEVIDKIDNGPQELYEIITESGNVLNCTLTHKLLCEDGQMRPLSDIISKNIRVMCQD